MLKFPKIAKISKKKILRRCFHVGLYENSFYFTLPPPYFKKLLDAIDLSFDTCWCINSKMFHKLNKIAEQNFMRDQYQCCIHLLLFHGMLLMSWRIAIGQV